MPAAPRSGRSTAGVATRRVAAVLASALVAPFATPVALCAQPVLAGTDDATLPRRGEIRARAQTRIITWGETFGAPGETGSTRRTPLGAPLTLDTIGAAQLPFVGLARTLLRDITGDATAPLSLGRIETGVRSTAIVTPITAEYGLSRRLAVSLTLPFSRNRTAIRPLVNAGGTTGNAGLNPARFGADGAAARTKNAAVQTAFSSAITDLEARIGAGTVDVALARQLATEATAVQRALAGLYGTGTGTGAAVFGLPVVPTVGSAAQRAVAERIAGLAGRFAALGVTALGTDDVPSPATARIAAVGLNQLLTERSLGIGTDSLRSNRRAGPGDIEAMVGFNWLDTFAPGDAGRFAPTGVRVRSTAWLGGRLGIANGDFPLFYLDVPPGTGASALLVRSMTDVTVGRWASVTGVVRLAAPFADRTVVRVPTAPGQLAFLPAYAQQEVSRTLGRELQLELTPRFALGERFGLFGQFVHLQRSADHYAGTFALDSATTGVGPVTLDASVLGVGTAQRAEQVGLGIAYSTLADHRRGRSRLPLEVSYLRTLTVAGAGGGAPRISQDQLTLRVYLALFTSRARRGAR